MPRRLSQILIACALLSAIWLTSWFDYRSHVAEHRQQFEALGQALVGAARGWALQLFRGGRYDPDELLPALDELRASLGADALSLRLPDQSPVEARSPSTAERSAEIFALDFAAPQPRSQGRHGPGPPGLVEAPHGPLQLALTLSTTDLDRRLSADKRRFLGLASSLTLALALALAVVVARERSLKLANELGRTQDQLRGLEFLRRLGAGLAHETRNPLGLVRGFAQQLADGAVTPERVRDVGRTLVDEVDRTVSRLDEFLLLSRPAELRRERFELRALLTDLIHLLEPDLATARARVELSDVRCEIDADREQTRRLFMNLMLNATQFLEPGGTLSVSVRDDESVVSVSVADDGPGVPESLRSTLFEPYVTGRPGGTGLGLAIAQRIATEHGWTITYQPVEPRGATFVVRIPKS